MEQENDKKVEALKKQMEDRLLIAKGKAQLAAHQMEYQVADIVDDLKDTVGAAVQTAKDKGTDLLNSAKEQAQASVDQTRKKAIDLLEQAKQKLEQ